MVVNSHNIFLHARKYPEMVLIKISMEQNQVKLTSPILDPITFTIPSSSETAETRIVKLVDFENLWLTLIDCFQIFQFYNVLCRVWGQKVSALDCGDEVAKWLSQQILNQDSGARLVYYPYSHSPRSVSTKPTLPFLKETDGVNMFMMIHFSHRPILMIHQFLKSEHIFRFDSISSAVNGICWGIELALRSQGHSLTPKFPAQHNSHRLHSICWRWLEIHQNWKRSDLPFLKTLHSVLFLGWLW